MKLDFFSPCEQVVTSLELAIINAFNSFCSLWWILVYHYYFPELGANLMSITGCGVYLLAQISKYG